MCSANYTAYYLERIPPPSKSPLFNSEAPPRLYSPARTGLKAGYRSFPLMSPLFLLPFQANYISSGLCCLGRLTGSQRKCDLPCAVILPAAQNSNRWLIRPSGCHRKHLKLATAPISAWKREENLPNTHAGGLFWSVIQRVSVAFSGAAAESQGGHTWGQWLPLYQQPNMNANRPSNYSTFKICWKTTDANLFPYLLF